MGTESREELWVFGYGSLMWQPGFQPAERRRARLTGFHRDFCIYSAYYRGTPRRPGLVLGLDHGGVCDGVLLRVPRSQASEVLAYLRRRELMYGVYREVHLPVVCEDRPGEATMALTYVAERAHPSYAGGLTLNAQARIIRGAAGAGGPNLDYLANTVRELGRLGLHERRLGRLLAVAGGFAGAREPSESGARPATQIMSRMFGRLPAGSSVIGPTRRARFQHRAFLANWGGGRS